MTKDSYSDSAYDHLKSAYADALDQLETIIQQTRPTSTGDKALRYVGESCTAISKYYLACITASPSDKRTQYDTIDSQYHYDQNGKCQSWDNLNLFTCAFSIISLQLAIEEWIIAEFGSPSKKDPTFKDHYQIVLNKIHDENRKEQSKSFFEALNILKNKAAHRHSKTTISENDIIKLKNAGFESINTNRQNNLNLNPMICINIIDTVFTKINQIKSYLNNP